MTTFLLNNYRLIPCSPQLFSLMNAPCFRSGLEWANSMAAILQRLFNAPAWKDVFQQYLTECIRNLSNNDEPKLSAIFALFVMAGFPEVRVLIPAGSGNSHNISRNIIAKLIACHSFRILISTANMTSCGCTPIFQQVLSVGSQVKYTDSGSETKHGVVMKHFQDKNQTLLVDKKSRRRRTVRRTDRQLR